MTQPSTTAEKTSHAELLPFCAPNKHTPPQLRVCLLSSAQLGSVTDPTAPSLAAGIFAMATRGLG